MACQAVWYAFEPDGLLLGGRIVAQRCGDKTGWREPHRPAHARQLAEAERLGLAMPDPARFPAARAAEQPALL